MTNRTTGAMAYVGKAALSASGRATFSIGAKLLQQFGSTTGYDQNPNWIFLEDVITTLMNGDFMAFLDEYGNTLADYVPTMIRILQCSSNYVMTMILSIIYLKQPDLATKYRKLVLMFTMIIKGLSVDESEKYNEIFESVDKGKKKGDFVGFSSPDDNKAEIKDLFIGFTMLYLRPENSRKNDMKLAEILQAINLEETFLIISAIRQVVVFLRDKEDVFEMPPLP